MMIPGLIPVAAGSYYVGNDESKGNNELDYFAFDYRGLIGFVQGLKGLGLASPKDFFSGLQNRAQHIFHTDPPQFYYNFLRIRGRLRPPFTDYIIANFRLNQCKELNSPR